MKHNLFIFLGGSDDQNGDYSAIHQLAAHGRTANWSSIKSAKPGDRALIYIQNPHSALVAKAEVLANPVKGKPGDYDYRAKTGRFELLPNQVGIQELKRKFPRWAWLRYPRGKAIVPPKYADRLWKLVHEKGSTVQILISKAPNGQQLLTELATRDLKTFWSAPKFTSRGDTVLFYAEKPVSAIVAVGKAFSRTIETRRECYQAEVGTVRLLDLPITLTELRMMFPDWQWLRSMSMFPYVSPDRAKALLERCTLKSLSQTNDLALAAGGGFGNAKSNALVEKAAVKKVTALLKRRGFIVRSRERERTGYDLDATRGRTELHVEVKGVSGKGMQFIITSGELSKAAIDSSFRLMVVTQARTSNARVREFLGRDLRQRFALAPISYFAKSK